MGLHNNGKAQSWMSNTSEKTERNLDIDSFVSPHPKKDQYQEGNISIYQRLFDCQLYKHVFLTLSVASNKSQ